MLKQRHGFSGRLTLTYDMTFLVLLLSALYEADEERGMELCPAHPLRRHFYWQTRYTDYAADMNVVLAYYNCRDDWQDDGSALKYWESEALSRQCAAARARWPRQCAVIEQCMAQLGEIEQADTGDMDAAANCFGRLMGELFSFCRERQLKEIKLGVFNDNRGAVEFYRKSGFVPQEQKMSLMLEKTEK